MLNQGCQGLIQIQLMFDKHPQCNRHWARNFHIISSILVTALIVQRRKLWLIRVKHISSAHTASKWQSQCLTFQFFFYVDSVFFLVYSPHLTALGLREWEVLVWSQLPLQPSPKASLSFCITPAFLSATLLIVANPEQETVCASHGHEARL